uniref:Matrin-type domain-containing protein n=1 Tax=Poecilia formosa TaxID=48698 RepID=A0A096MB26_POEFO
ASLQLAQLKAQLALTQMNNVLTVGGYAPTLTSNTHIPAPGLPTKPPSPTAVAINLLNLLKIANTMSHPMYNPFAPSKQMPSHGPYGLSGSSGLTCGPSGGPIPSIMSLPGSYRPERNKITVDEDIDRCLDLNISRAREEVIQTSSSQNTQFTNVQRDIFPSSNKGMPSYLTSPSTLRGSEEESTKKYSSASSTFQGSGESLFSTSSEGKHMSSIPGLGGYDIKRPAKFVPPPEPIRPKYTSESASNILLQFGLEKEDLEHLISYPEDQITPENLPFILREIKLEKEKKTATAVQSNPYSATQPIRSKVIDYGHTGKYTTEVGNEVGRTVGSSSVAGMDSFKPSSHVRDPLQRGPGELKTGPAVTSHGQMSSVSTVDSLRSPVGRPALPTPAQVPIRPLLPMSAPVLLRPSLPTPAQGRMDAMPRMPPPVFKDQTSAPKMGPSKLPTPAMMKDYAAATPRIFPHTCCLCMKECTNMKDWLSHQNTSLHLDNCRLLRLRCPDWDGTTLELLSPQRQRGSEDGKESPHHHYGSESRRQKRSSRSRSHSPQRHHSSDGQRERRSSRSPHTSRHSRRSRSRSYDRPTSSHHRSRSRSYERRSPPRKREAKRSSPRRNYERRSSPRRSDERHSSPRRSREARSPAERSAPQRKRSRSADRLAKRLLETTAVQSLSKQSNLEAMVKTLAPALLAELAKMKSFSNIEKKTSSAKSAKATSSRPKSGKSSSAKPMFISFLFLQSAESLSAGKVRLSSVSASLSHDDIFDALEKFGKVKEVNIARASLQAVIHFEKEADAEKVKKLQCLQVKGLTVYVDKKMDVWGLQRHNSPLTLSFLCRKSAESSTTSTGKAKARAVPGAKSIATGQVAPKAKGVPTKQVAVKKPNTAGKKNQPVAAKAESEELPLVSKTVDTEGTSEENQVEECLKKIQKPPQFYSEQSVTDVSSHLTPEPVSDVVAVKLDEPTSAEAKPDEAAAAPADLFSLAATVKTEKEEQQKETTCASLLPKTSCLAEHAAEKTVKSSTPLSKDSHNEKQPPPQTRASVSPTPAEPIQSGSVKADMMAGKNEAGVVAVPTASRKSNENPERKRSPRAPVVPAENRATPDPSTSTMSVAALGNLEDDDAELPQINQDESKDDDNYTDPFDEFGFNFGDFVTVDEISEEMDDTLVEDTSVSLESTSRDATERQSPDVSSAASKTSTRSSKNCKSSTSFSSRSEKGSDSLSSTSESENKQKPSSEPPKFETKTSSVSGVKTSPSTPSSSVKTPPSSAQKSQSNKSKPPVRSSETSSSGRSTRSSSAAAIKSSAGTQQVGKKDVKPKENAVAKSDHQVSAESCSAKTVESELRMKTMKIQHAEGQSSQIQNLKSDFKNVKEMKKNEVKDKKKDMDGKSTEEKRGNNENTQILDSFKEKSDGQKNKDDNQDRRTEIQISGPEQDHLVQQGADNDNGPSDECQEMEVDESTKLQDGALKDQAATADDRETNQTPNSSKVKQHNDIRLSERVCEISKEVGQTSNEEDQNSLKQQDKTRTYVTRTKDSKIEKEESLEDFEEMVYEVVDSIEDDSVQEPSTTGSCSRRQTPRGNRKDEKTSPPVEEPKKSDDEEEEVFTVLDSVEEESPSEKPVVTRSTRRRENTAKKAEENTKTKEDKTPTRRRCTPVRDSKESAPTKSNSAVASTGHEDTTYMELDAVEYDQPTTQKPRRESTPTKKSDAAVASTSDEDSTYEEVDAAGDGQPTTQKPRRGRPKTDNKTSKKQTEEDEEPVYQIVDSVGDQERRHTPARDSQENDREKTPKPDVCVPPVESAPTKKNDARHLGGQETTYEVLDAVEEQVVEAATRASRRGRPKKDNKTSKKQTEYLKVDSPRKDEVADDVAPIDQSECAKTSSAFADDDITKEMISPSTVEPFGQTGGGKETQLAGKPLEDKEDLSAKGSDTEGKADVVGEDESLNQPNNHLGASEESTLTSPKSKDTEATENILVNLDQVSEDEEDYPDDAAEEEELKKRQAAAQVEVDAQDLVTLDEVGEDEVGEEAVTEAPTWEVELQDLVTLDEIVEEEEGQLEAPPQSLESQSKDSLQPETSSTLTETTQIEDNRDDDNHPKEPSSSSKLKQAPGVRCLDLSQKIFSLCRFIQWFLVQRHHSLKLCFEKNILYRPESGNFVTVDEVGEVEEEEEKEAVTRKGRPRKRSRQTPVRKSTRGKTVKEENHRQEEEENKSLPPASLDSSSTLDTSGPSGDAQCETQRTEEGKNTEAASAEHQPLHNDGLRLGCEEAEKQEHRRADATVQSSVVRSTYKSVDKRKRDLTGPEAKRSRSQSPSVSANLQLPPFNPRNPLGKEFVNPTSGFFCSLCSVFYLNEDTAKEVHCSSQEHYDNLKNYYQRLQQNVQGSPSD